jgi:acyl-CoA synthetase (AMP-forming)/AMP-acid ligase II
VWRAVEEHRISGIAITGDAMAIPLLDALDDGDYDVSSLVSFSSTAAVFSPVVKDRLFELLSGVFVTEAVGSSESGFNGIRLIEKGNTANPGGLINVNMGPDTLVIGDDDRPVQPGEVGRMARGGNVPIEYYKDPEKSAKTFITVDGKRYSVPGDFARLEVDGTMTLLGRGSQCINSGGEKIYPEEVEAALKSHPAVFDALVVGVTDERWGQRVAAIVQPRPGDPPTLDDLIEHCRTKIAGYKVPRELHLTEAMPRHPSGKPDYRRARALTEGDTMQGVRA